ncbi:MAG: phosphatidylglycerophosphatase A [Nitrospirota bacterium]|nr:phosphatidylglycerophosphatase A [Nitrospirota bacterium]MDH5768096.1 phosphatidylglycerophosphatase A [Nitrospirota bacterium]
MSILKYVATLGFIGYIPFAPGTFGTLTAFIFFILLRPSSFIHLILLFFVLLVGIISSHHAERLLNSKDSRHIVIDEFCGYFLSVLFIPFSISYALAAFFLFRFFDILKPFPIKKIEAALVGGIGVMADDIMAAIYTNIILQIWILVH